MKSIKKNIAIMLVIAMMITMFAGISVINVSAAEAVYNFSDIPAESYGKKSAEVFNGAVSLSGTENIAQQNGLNFSTVMPDGSTANFTSAAKVKKLSATVTLEAGETLIVYYVGSDSAGAAAKALDMQIKDADTNEVVATEENVENKEMKPYTISYKSETGGRYTAVDGAATTNRTIMFGLVITSDSSFVPGGTVTPSTPTATPTVTDPDSPTPTPAPTDAPTASPKPTLDPSIPSSIANVSANGWLETAYVTWTNAIPVDKYNVYVKPENGEYTKIDDELVRYYGSYYRADALGLKAGNYQLKIEAIIGGAVADEKETDVVSVKAHVREGYAFDPTSPHYHADGVGGYKNDGTVKDGAKIVYIDDTNKDTVKFDVVTDTSKNTVTTCTGLVEILAAREKNKAETTPLIIRMIGQVESPAGKNSAGYVQIKSARNITFEGVGDDATTYHWSFLLRETENVEVRNLAVMEFYDDGISLDTNNFNDWVHNCDIFYGQNRGGDQKKGDGSLDVKSGSDYCTFSYNHFWDSGKSSLCGMKSDSYQGYHMTYHHNWFDHSDSRHPRVRGDIVHVYNNYYDGNSKYGIGATTGSNVFAENNVFRNCLHPVLISQQGSDISGNPKGTFSGEAGGMVKMYGNQIIGGIAPVTQNENATEFDAYFASARDEQVPSTFKTLLGESTYNNFDTASSMYSYTPTATENVVDEVRTYSGRVAGGDFTHTFNNDVDDKSYDRDTVLGNALQNYRSSLVKSYTAVNEYPGTGGAMPTARPTAEPFDPSTQPTSKPSGSGGSTTPGEKSSIWRASDTAQNITNGTKVEEWLTVAGGDLTYASSNRAIDGVSFSGKMNAAKGTSAPTLTGKGQDGPALKMTALEDGKFRVFYKLNSGKTFYILDKDGNTVGSYNNSSAENGYFSITVEAAKDMEYYAFADGSNAEFWGVEYITAGDSTDDGDEPSDPVSTATAAPSETATAAPSETATAAPSETATAAPSETATPKPTRRPSTGGGSFGNSGLSTSGSSSRPAATPEATIGPNDATPAPTDENGAPMPTTAPVPSTFVDVNADDWFYSVVMDAVQSGLMNGTSSNTFEPNTNITRGMFVTVLNRMEGSPVGGASTFADVPSDAYYANAVAWAVNSGIVTGYSDSEFRPDSSITREEMSAMIYRYKVSKGEGPQGAWAINLEYNDLEDVADFALESLMFNTINGFIKGDDFGNFNPKSNTTRAEAAAVFGRIK